MTTTISTSVITNLAQTSVNKMAKRKRPLSRKQKIEAIVEQVDGWDLETLIDYAKDRMREALKTCSPETLDEEYHNNCVGD